MAVPFFVQVGILWLAVLTCGMSSTFPAIGLPAFADSGVTLTPAQESVVGSVRQVGVVIGALIIGPLLDNWGRRSATLTALIPGIIGYAVIFISESVIAFCVGLCMEGIAMGMINSSAPVYLAEILSKRWRGAVSVTRNVCLSVGMTLTYILGLLLKGKIQLIAFLAFIVPSSALAFGLCFLKETEVWVDDQKSGKSKKTSFGGSYKNFWKALTTRPEVYRPFSIFNFLNFLRHSSGVGVITNYTLNIIVDLGATSDPYIVAIVLGIFRIGGGLAGMLLCTLFRRNHIMSSSGILMTLSMIGLSVIQFLENLPKFLPEILLITFVFTSIVFLAVSMSLQGEIYPTDLRGMCSSTTMTLSNLFAALVLFAYPLFKSWIGSGLLMMSYAVSCCACVLVIFYFVPNTDNKTLEEIGEMFQNKTDDNSKAEESVPLRNSVGSEASEIKQRVSIGVRESIA